MNRHLRIEELWAILNSGRYADGKCADVKSVMKEIHLLMDENHADDTRADDMAVKAANITLDCDSVVPAIMCHEPADMNGEAINHLIPQAPQPIVDPPFYCDQAVVSGGDLQRMATIKFFTSDA